MHAKLYQYHLNGGQILNANANKIKVPFRFRRKKKKESLKICGLSKRWLNFISIRPSRWLIPPCILFKVLPSNGPNSSPHFIGGVAMGLRADETLWAAALFSSILQKNTDSKYLLSQCARVSVLHTGTSTVQKRWESVFCNNFSLMFFHSNRISYLKWIL